MERARRAPVGTFYAPGDWRSGAHVELDAAAAHHASVKRIAAGDVIRLTNGAGRRASGMMDKVSKQRCVVVLGDEPVEDIAAPSHIELWAPVGDRDRMLMLAEKSVELGLSSWKPVVYSRSRSVSPRGEGDSFLEKLRLRQVSALEQSGGAWLPELHAEVPLAAALEAGNPRTLDTKLLLDVDGEALGTIAHEIVGDIAVAVGPEGGLEVHEREAFITHGWRPVSLGRNILRFETAGVAALAVLRALSPTGQ